ncbi:hypothetical protein MKZ38_010797 [Zalerion maritima]|uniref:Uncharacterized protein n=1 Tax=Zalerion maritima TaxID=339359 RepID=A0AAD5RY39_9PEZI|nr:hypothetical protein MKZ38_010797 [Zalerion maritima]
MSDHSNDGDSMPSSSPVTSPPPPADHVTDDGVTDDGVTDWDDGWVARVSSRRPIFSRSPAPSPPPSSPPHNPSERVEDADDELSSDEDSSSSDGEEERWEDDGGHDGALEAETPFGPGNNASRYESSSSLEDDSEDSAPDRSARKA